jgi:hypothetical protein
MRFCSFFFILLGLLAASELAVAGGHTPGCPNAHACGNGHCQNPCAQTFRVDCLPLPPIAFSRYADNGDYDCTRAVFCDGVPKHSFCQNYWYGYRQPYPLTHAEAQNSTPAVRIAPAQPCAGCY